MRWEIRHSPSALFRKTISAFPRFRRSVRFPSASHQKSNWYVPSAHAVEPLPPTCATVDSNVVTVVFGPPTGHQNFRISSTPTTGARPGGTRTASGQSVARTAAGSFFSQAAP